MALCSPLLRVQGKREQPCSGSREVHSMRGVLSELCSNTLRPLPIPIYTYGTPHQEERTYWLHRPRQTGQIPLRFNPIARQPHCTALSGQPQGLKDSPEICNDIKADQSEPLEHIFIWPRCRAAMCMQTMACPLPDLTCSHLFITCWHWLLNQASREGSNTSRKSIPFH